VSILLGGVYYPTHVIPVWLQRASLLLPLTYGLRALRQTALLGASWSSVATDMIVLAAYSAVLLTIGGLTLALALRSARRTGSLGQY
jgi:ABC-type multidrug transport system permease subunit